VFIAISIAVLRVAGVSRIEFRAWVDRWSVAEWAVALGTLTLAAFTLALARESRRQIALQREQIQAAQRPVVYPVTPADWAMGGGVSANRRKMFLPVANGGPGVALNVTGRVMQRPERGSGVRESQIIAGSIGPGGEQYARLDSEWPSWNNTIGFLRYWDLLGNEWITDFTCGIAIGDQISIEARPPRRAGDPGPEYPPPEWNQPRD
jgi:hypothetical protein